MFCAHVVFFFFFFFFKQKTAYEMRISDWSSDVCSSDLDAGVPVAAESQVLERRVLESGCRCGCGDNADARSVERGGMAVEQFEIPEHDAVEVCAGHVDPERVRVGRLSEPGARLAVADDLPRSEGRRVGDECVRTCSTRWARY